MLNWGWYCFTEMNVGYIAGDTAQKMLLPLLVQHKATGWRLTLRQLEQQALAGGGLCCHADEAHSQQACAARQRGH